MPLAEHDARVDDLGVPEHVHRAAGGEESVCSARGGMGVVVVGVVHGEPTGNSEPALLTLMADGDIPYELAHDILRVLDVQHEDDIERLADFNPLASLNTLFPDQPALGEIDAISGRLREDQRALQAQIDQLQADLRRDQDPDRMQLIQEMIGVRARREPATARVLTPLLCRNCSRR